MVLCVIRKYDGKKGVRWHVITYHKGVRAFGGTYPTQKEARRAEAVLLLSYRPPDAKDPFDLRCRRHLEGLKKTLGRATYANYASTVDKYIIPWFGSRPVGSITTQDLEDYYSDLTAKGLAAATIYQHHAILRKFFRTLKRKGVCGDPSEGAVWGRKVRYIPRTLDMDQLKQLLSDYEKHWLYLPVLIAATAGLRRGEICGLLWEDYIEGALLVRRSLGEQKGLYRKLTKTENVRAVPLPVLTRDVLDGRRLKWAAYCKKIGIPLGYICCHMDGSPLRPSTVSDSFSRNRYGIRFHDLRHSHATIMAISGESPEAVRQRLGHTSVQTTLDLYTHLAGAQWDSVNRWDEQWCREGDSNPHD